MVLSRQTTAEVREETNAVLVEAEAAGDATLAGVAARRQPEAETFLLVRLRLAAAADEAVSAARGGDGPRLRRQLHRFDALASAIWVVQDAVYASGSPRPPRERLVRM